MTSAARPLTVNRDRFIDTLLALCSIPSPSGTEGAVAYRIREIARSSGARIRDSGTGDPAADPAADAPTRSQGTMILTSENTHPERLFLSAHMDTVPVPPGTTEIVVVRSGGRISTDGATVLGGDDKVGVAAALEMLALCGEYPEAHRSLEVIITVGEEIGCAGSRRIDPSVISARTGFNLDGETPPFSAIRRAPRKTHYTCTVHGRSAHGALNPDDGINAIVVAAHLVPRLPTGTLDEHSTANVGAIRGGAQTNIVPDRVEIRAEMRSFQPDRFELHKETIRRACAGITEEFGVPVDLDWQPAYEEYEIGPEEPCALWFSNACRRLGREPDFRSSRGGGDSNNLNRIGLRNVVFGLGMHNIHTPEEYLVEEEILDAVELLREIVFPAG